MLKPGLLPLIEAEWHGHLAGGLAQLRRTPSGGVRSLCDAILAEPDHFTPDRLLRMAAGRLSQAERDHNAVALQRYQAADTTPVFLLRAGLAHQISEAPDATVRTRLQAALDGLGAAATPKAPALRQALFPLLAVRFGSKPAKDYGAEYRMALGPAGRASLQLWMDFGGMARGIRWAVEVVPAGGGPRIGSTSYEALLGLPVTDWNVLRSDCLAPDMALLVERVARTVEIIGSVGWD